MNVQSTLGKFANCPNAQKVQKKYPFDLELSATVRCMIKIFRGGRGGRGGDTFKTPPPTNNFCLYPPPVLRCFWKDPLMNGCMVFNSDRPENSTQNQSSSGKLEFTDLPHGILFFQGWPGILYPSPCMDKKWNTTFNDIKMQFKITFNTGYCSSISRLSYLLLIISHLQDQDIIVFSLIFSLAFH